MFLFLLLLAMTAGKLPAAAQAEAEKPGNVCFSAEGDFRGNVTCRQTEKASFKGDLLQPFYVWRSESNAFLWIGRQQPPQSAVQFDQGSAARLTLRIVISNRDDGIAAVVKLVDRSRATWVLPFSIATLNQLRTISVPLGRYDLTIDVPGYWPEVLRGIGVRRGITTVVPTIRLIPLPRMSGVVRDGKSGEPIGGASIEMANGDSSTVTDASGQFSLSFTSSSYLTIRAHGYANRDVAVPAARGDLSLPAIYLSSGGRLRATVQRECTANCESTAIVYRRRDEEIPARRWKEVARRTSSGANAHYVFEGLDDGSYAFLLEGRGPLQKHVTYFAIHGDETSEQSTAVYDRTLKGTITLGSSPLSKAAIILSNDQLLWSARVETDEKGDYATAIWDDGVWTMRIEAPHETEPYFAVRNLSDVAEQFWDVAIPLRFIDGVVLDADSNDPVPGAHVVDEVASSGARFTATDADGKFRFAMVGVGGHALHVESPGYLDSSPIRIELNQSDAHDLKFRISHGTLIHFRVIDENGNPLPSIELYDWVGDMGIENRSPYLTDAWGMTAIPVGKGKQKPVYVINRRSGSFAFAVADPSLSTSINKPMDVKLAPAIASLALRTTTHDLPIVGVQFLVRVNGTFLPPRMWDIATGVNGLTPTMTGLDGRLAIPHLPPGTYEFWPYRDLSELRRLFSSIYVVPPKRATLAPGVNVVDIEIPARGSEH
jgi:hypothetical protein